MLLGCYKTKKILTQVFNATIEDNFLKIHIFQYITVYIPPTYALNYFLSLQKCGFFIQLIISKTSEKHFEKIS